MTSGSSPSQASFPCDQCQKPIFIPVGLPPTTAPCPHCGASVTSPDQNAVPASKPQATAPMPVGTSAQPKNTVAIPPAPVEEKPIRLEADKERAPVPPAAAVGPATHAIDEVSASAKQTDGPKKEPQTESAQTTAKKSNAPVVLTAIIILLLAGGATFWLADKWKKDQATPSVPTVVNRPPISEEGWIEDGWKKDAEKVLGGFLTASTPEEKMQYVIPNKGVLDELKNYFPDGKETDTPLSAFSFNDGNKTDRERGIFLMRYRRPAQIDIRTYFAPIGSLEAVMGQEAPTLIETAYRIDESSLAQPVGINAFFKKTKDGLKLDASVFIQGRFRTFKSFTEYPQPGKSKVFRVVLSETLIHALRNDTTRRAYRFSDFAYPQDFVNLPIEVDSEVGKTLSVINWRGENKPVAHRTATVELMWSDTLPSKLELKKILCWEFLGVGGELGNTDPKTDESSDVTPAPTSEEEGKTS